jgi:hypothetical protein
MVIFILSNEKKIIIIRRRLKLPPSHKAMADKMAGQAKTPADAEASTFASPSTTGQLRRTGWRSGE